MFKYTDEQKDFIYKNNHGKYAKELADIFNSKFGTNITPMEIKNFRRNHHLNSGLTGRFEKGCVPFNKGTKGLMKANKTSFKKGNIPYNHKEVGYERVNVDGYLEVKVKEPNEFKLKHRIVWEKANGPIPKNYNVIFLDGNKAHIELSNLALVKDSELLILNKRKLISEHQEITQTGINIAKVINKVYEKSRL